MIYTESNIIFINYLMNKVEARKTTDFQYLMKQFFKENWIDFVLEKIPDLWLQNPFDTFVLFKKNFIAIEYKKWWNENTFNLKQNIFSKIHQLENLEKVKRTWQFWVYVIFLNWWWFFIVHTEKMREWKKEWKKSIVKKDLFDFDIFKVKWRTYNFYKFFKNIWVENLNETLKNIFWETF